VRELVARSEQSFLGGEILDEIYDGVESTKHDWKRVIVEDVNERLFRV
jgi:hypothetical protein